MDLSALRQQILLSNKTVSEKAEAFLLKSQVNDLSKDEWRNLIAGIPEDVEKAIALLKSAGTQLHLHICLIEQGQQLALQVVTLNSRFRTSWHTSGLQCKLLQR